MPVQHFTLTELKTVNALQHAVHCYRVLCIYLLCSWRYRRTHHARGAITKHITYMPENAPDAILSHAYLKTDFGWTCASFDMTVNIKFIKL